MTDNVKQSFMAPLSDGIDILCGNDEEINRIVSRRKNEILPHLERYIKEIELFNPALKLVGTNDTSELIIKHILDSIAPAGILSGLLNRQNSLNAFESSAQPRENQIADIGSGAGLPGIPLAIIMPDNKFTLVERMERRAGFLLNTKAVLKLSNITIEEKEAEKINNADGFDLITFRASLRLDPKLFKTLLKKCAPNGIIAAYKGKLEKTKAEMTSLINTVSAEKIEFEIIPYTVPFLNEERCLLVIKNIP